MTTRDKKIIQWQRLRHKGTGEDVEISFSQHPLDNFVPDDDWELLDSKTIRLWN